MEGHTQAHERSVNEPFKKFRCLVTGGQGFIGAKVVTRLRELGHDVVPYDIVDGNDLLDLAQLELAMKKCDVVYHIAAQADLTKMSASPEAGYAGVMANVMATNNVAFLASKLNKWIIYASTVCVYGNQENHPEKEDETLPNPSELYACSKYAAEWLVRGYALNFKNPWTSLRFATIYGEGMRPALGLHVFFRQALGGSPITVHGDGAQTRTLTYIGDLVDGIVAPLTSPEKAKGQIFNLSSKVAVSALQMAQDVRNLTATTSEITHTPQRDNQTLHEDFDVSKAKKLLGWETKTSWKDGLKATHAWMQTL